AEVRVRAHATLSRQSMVGFDLASAAEHAEAAVAFARATGEVGLLAEALGVSAEVRFSSGTGDLVADLEEIESIARTTAPGEAPTGPGRHVRALSLIFADEIEPARVILDELLAEADATGDEAGEGRIRGALGVLELRAGNLASAQLQLERS